MRFDNLSNKQLLEFAGVDTTKGKAKALVEKWEHEAHMNPEKKGMFDGRSKASMEAELAHLRSSGPHHEGSPEYTKEKELSFALRAKSGWGEEEEQQDDHLTCGECEGTGRVKSLATGRMNDCTICMGRGHIPSNEIEDDDEEDYSDMADPMMGAEEEEWGVKHTGQNTDQSVETLQHQAAAAKRSGNTKRVRQKDFAIRAKTGWGSTK
jgi:hypothetical protein